MTEFYRKCKFKRFDKYTEAYIPEESAKVGFKIELGFEGFWELIELTDVLVTKDFIKQHLNYNYMNSTGSGGIQE